MKKIFTTIIALICTFTFVGSVNAATGSITASSSSSQVVVGSTFNVTVKVSCSEALGSWQFGIAYDSAYISLQSGDTSVASYGDGSTKTKTYTYKFKAIKSGSAGVRITGASMVSWNDVNTLFTPSTSNASVRVRTQAEIEASYSKNNNLKSLSVTGYELSPAFDKDTLEYSLEVPDDVTSVEVKASVADSTASVRGTGTIDVSEGGNRIEVVVTAQNGSTKTYVLNITVKDLTPIEVTIAGDKYTVVKKEALLTNPTGYTPSTIKINDIDVPAYTSEITHFTLVGLKNDITGEIKMYMYDSSSNSYSIYNEVKSSALTLYPIDADEVPKGYIKEPIVIGDAKYDSYRDEKTNLTFIYAMNIENGEKGFYLYDKGDVSLVKFDIKSFSDAMSDLEDYKLYLTAAGGIIVVLFLLATVLSSKNKKLKKLLLKVATKDNITEENSKIENSIDDKAEKEDNKDFSEEVSHSESNIVENTQKKSKKIKK